jgi:type IV pilus assembly protein PilM
MSTSSQPTTVVNLGAAHVSISSFHVRAGQLVLEKFVLEDLPPGLTGEDEWLSAAISTLTGLVKQHNLKGTATVIVPGFLLLSKSLKVPQVERERQAQIIAFEAQNNIPYPLSEVVWGSQIIASDGVEAEVLLFALRAEISARIANQVSAAGLRPTIIQAAPLLDSQAWRLSSADSPEEVVVVNVGARTTTLSFMGPAGMSVQSATLGGNTLTQSVSDGTGSSFQNAEALKVGYFSGVVQLAESDPQAATLISNAQAFSRRLAQDINRRLVGLRRGTQGRQPTRILLTGRAAQLGGLQEQLAETLRLPVEILDPLNGVTLSSNVNPEYVSAYRLQLSEPVGEAARMILADAAGVNLIPPEIAAQLAFDARKPLLIGSALLLALSPLPILAGLYFAAESTQAQVTSLKLREREFSARKANIADTRQQSSAIASVNSQMESVVLNRTNWNEFLVELQKVILANRHTWIEELRVTREQPPAPAVAEGEPPAPLPHKVIKVTLVTRMLLLSVGPAKDAVIDAKEFGRRQQEFVQALRQNAFVEAIPDAEIRSDRNQPNLPRLTLTLIIKSDKPL